MDNRQFHYDCAFGIIRVNPNHSPVTIKWFGLYVFGGAKGSRTPDLLNAIQTRYQLRYNPELLLYNNISIRLLSSVFAKRIFIFT